MLENLIMVILMYSGRSRWIFLHDNVKQFLARFKLLALDSLFLALQINYMKMEGMCRGITKKSYSIVQ